MNTLFHLKFNSTIYGVRGVHGKGKNRRGADGADSIINVPFGTEVSVWGGNGTKRFLTDIPDATDTVVAQGGKGGRGNSRFVSPTHQQPVLAERGERGESIVLFLELKLLADVGLLARPNVGKSTLISRCSGAKARVADYPFTTVEPVLGMVGTHGEEFVMMEIPGLLDGAHRGVGLGHAFLRHAERARLYIYLVDGLSDDPLGDLKMLNDELIQFNPALASKPKIVAVNKIDLTEVRDWRNDIETALCAGLDGRGEGISADGDSQVVFISAATGEGVEVLLGKVMELLATMPKDERRLEERAVPSDGPQRGRKPWSVRKESGAYVVESEELERLVSLADTRDRRVLLQLWREMTRRGVARRLESFGIQPGDTIRIGGVEVEWF